MLQKIKSSAIFIVISMYIFGIFSTFSGDLLIQVQKIRHENQIQKIKNSETLVFTHEEWNSFWDKKEINYKNAFYDVISFKKTPTNFIVKAIKDNDEDEFRILLSQILNKNKFPPIEKKENTFFSKHIVQENILSFSSMLNFSFIIIDNYDTFFHLKTKSFIYLFLHPPCRN